MATMLHVSSPSPHTSGEDMANSSLLSVSSAIKYRDVILQVMNASWYDLIVLCRCPGTFGVQYFLFFHPCWLRFGSGLICENSTSGL